ncbi:uncharacterized [Tachysurus ichikawai]
MQGVWGQRGWVSGALALTLPAPDAGQGGGHGMAAWAAEAARGSSTGAGSSGCLRSDWCGERIPRPFFAQRSLPFPSFSSFSPSQSLHRPLASSRKCTCDNSPRSHSNHPVAETQEKARGRGREAREGERRAKKRKGRHRRARKTGKGKSNADLKYSTTVM